ncbi:hypothetical protein [Ancylobacter terrae]|uniref:hypothetical protein n=1 Tax=Ancylobacter sp. sgz301288 TaxID=3342077 RepID=UPI00385FB333
MKPTPDASPSADPPPLFSHKAFESARLAWERNWLAMHDPASTGTEHDQAELPLAVAAVTAPVATIDGIIDKLQIILRYAGPGAGMQPDSYERITLMGLHMVLIDLEAIER